MMSDFLITTLVLLEFALVFYLLKTFHLSRFDKGASPCCKLGGEKTSNCVRDHILLPVPSLWFEHQINGCRVESQS